MNFSTEAKTIVMPISRMHPGTHFLPIVDEGREFLVRDRRGHLVKRRQRIALDDCHIKIDGTRCQNLHNAKDAIFAFYDKGVVLVGFHQRLTAKQGG